MKKVKGYFKEDLFNKMIVWSLLPFDLLYLTKNKFIRWLILIPVTIISILWFIINIPIILIAVLISSSIELINDEK